MVAALYAVVFAVVGGETAEAIFGHADVSSAPFTGDAYRGGDVVLGYFPWYEALWFEQVTRWVPGHRELWTWAPWLLSLGGLALAAWSVATATGRRWAGVWVFCAGFCAGTTLLGWQFAWSIHSLAWVHLCVLGAFAVRARPLWLAVLVGAFTALGCASDNLVLVGAVAPCAAAALALIWTGTRRHGLTLLGVAAVSALLSIPIAVLARSAGITAAHLDISAAGPAKIWANAKLYAQALPVLLGGDFKAHSGGLRGALAIACALNVAGLLAAGAAHALRALRERSPEPLALVVYWGSALVLLSAAFAFTTAPVDIASSRYLVGAAYAVAVLGAVALSRRPGLAGAAFSVLALSGLVSLTAKDLAGDPYRPTPAMAEDVERVASRWHAREGYASYWDAAALSWYSDGALRLYPAFGCGPGKLCPFDFHRAERWYRPKPGRALVVTDSGNSAGNKRALLLETGASFGEPLAVERLGRLTVYVYARDPGL